MGEDAYPSSEFRQLVQAVRTFGASTKIHNWTGNDEIARNYHAVVDLGDSPLRVSLSWRKSPNHPVRLLGLFELQLMQLRKAGFIRNEPNKVNKVRVRFYHAHDGLIYVQVNSAGPKIPIGVISS